MTRRQMRVLLRNLAANAALATLWFGLMAGDGFRLIHLAIADELSSFLTPSSSGAKHTFASGWGRLDEAAARYLRTWVHVQQGNASTAEATKRLLDAVPKPRITKSRLIEAAALGDDAGEAEWVLPTGTDLRGLPTYQMRTILADCRINGRVQFLTSWEPTWEPAVNLPSNEIRIYR
ncbi:hypothetical protein F442_23212 [Phytophthora nicotianae P10297]|uniref:Uncharacterized protein n=1 Tax=Phytophthora nicotianae P10297 TaxID=1317064 RepID=W2XYA8_PHYNI|nr:hypothetical protein F442_23212 [Phytophthora nicotianae P10297]